MAHAVPSRPRRFASWRRCAPSLRSGYMATRSRNRRALSRALCIRSWCGWPIAAWSRPHGRTKCTRRAAPASVPADGDGLAAATTAAIPQTTAAREGAALAAASQRGSRLGGGPVDRLSLPAAAVLRWCARLLPAGRAEWAEAILAEAENVPAGCQRLAWLGGGLRMVSGESMIMRKAGAICAFAVAVGSCQLELATVSGEPGDGGQQGQPASDRGTARRPLGSRAPARWSCARRTRAAARPGRRLLSGSRANAMQGVRGAHARPRDPGARSGRPAVDRRSAVPAEMAIFTAVVIMATAQRSPVTTGTLLRGIAAGLPIGIAVFVFLPLGVVRYQASRCCRRCPRVGSTCLDRGARCGRSPASGRAPVHVRPGTAACGGSGFRV